MTATAFSGRVAKIYANPFTSKKTGKPGTAYKLVIASETGQEFPGVGGFFDPPACEVGDSVSVSATENNGYYNVVKGSLKVTAKAAPIQVQVPHSAAAGTSVTYAGPVVGAPRTGYKTNPEDAKRITYQASLSRAIETVVALLANKALPISAAASKAAESDRFDTVLAAIDKLTVRYFNDAMTLRRLETVADETPDTAADGPLPGGAESEIP